MTEPVPVPVPLPVFDDDRGRLVPLDLDRVPFVPRRVFVVTGPPEGSTRGGHTVPCRELVVLVSGSATVRSDGVTTTLTTPGEQLLLEPGGEMDYDLAPGGSTILVLADAPYGREPS